MKRLAAILLGLMLASCSVGYYSNNGMGLSTVANSPIGVLRDTTVLTSTISPSITSTTMLTEPCSTTTTTDNGCRLNICPTAWVIRATFTDSTRWC